MTNKILVITDNLINQVNGVVTTFTNLQKQAEKDGYEISFIDPSSFKHISAPGYPEVKLSWAWGIGKKIEEHKPCHIHISTEGPLGLAARLYCDRKGYVYNTSYHTKFPEFLKKIYYIPEFLTYGYLKWFHKHSGIVMTTTNSMVRDLEERGFKGKIVPWTRGVDREIFDATQRQRQKEKIFLYVGRVSKEKGLDDFCELVLPGMKIIVGDGPYKEELQKKYPAIEFAGVKRGKQLAWFYNNADVFVFPSRTDTFGIVLIEALACGTPVAAYPVTGPIDIIENGVDGCLNINLQLAVQNALDLDRNKVLESSQKWTWEKCWEIFKENLCEINK